MPVKTGIQWNPESQVFTVDIGLFPCYGFANMARPLQREYPGAYHLTFRGKEKKPVQDLPGSDHFSEHLPAGE